MSQDPLYVTALGISDAEAAQHVQQMHGPHSIPSLWTRVDHLCRGLAQVRAEMIEVKTRSDVVPYGKVLPAE